MPKIEYSLPEHMAQLGRVTALFVCIGKQAAAQYKRSALKTHVGTGATLH